MRAQYARLHGSRAFVPRAAPATPRGLVLAIASDAAPRRARPSPRPAVVSAPRSKARSRAVATSAAALATEGPSPNAPSRPVVRLFRPAGAGPPPSAPGTTPTRPALVFLPGTDGTSHGLDTQVARLAAAGWDLHAACYEADNTAWGWDAAVEATAAAIARLRGGEEGGGSGVPVLLVGESFGACLALRLAAREAKATTATTGPTALALINPATAFPRALGGLPALLARSGLLGAAPDAAYGLAQRILLPLLLDRGRAGRGGEAAAGLMMAMAGDDGGGGGVRPFTTPARPAAAASHRLALMMEAGGLGEADLASIGLPTLLIASGGDALLPSLTEASRLERLIPGAAAEVVPGGGGGGGGARPPPPRRPRLVLPDSGHAPLLEEATDLASLLEAGGLGPADLMRASVVAPPTPTTTTPAAAGETTSPVAALPPWALPDPAVDAACEALSPLRALIAPSVTGAEDHLPSPFDPGLTTPNGTPRPLLFVANHARFGLYDLPFLVAELYARGVRVRGVAHPAHWRGPLGPLFERLGAIRSSPRAVLRSLSDGEACLLFPGGGREVTKPRGAEHTLLWRSSPDAVRLAARAGALIIPVSCVGADDAYTLLADTRDILSHPLAGPAVRAGLSTLLPGAGLTPEEAVFPIAALPLPAFLPALPIPAPIPVPRPARLYFEVCAPIDAAGEVEAAGGGLAGAAVVYGRVKEAVEAGIARQLAAREADGDGMRSFEARAGRVARRWLG